MQILLNGAITGLAIAALALAFTLVYLPCRVFHLALGGIYALAPFVLLSLGTAGAPWALAVVGSVLTGAALSGAIELGNHAPLRNRNAAAGAHLISSLGLYLIISQFISITWGDQARYLRHSIYGLIAFGPVSISRSQLAETVTCISLLAGVGALLSSSGTGLKLRALAANENQFAIEGNDVRRLRLIAFALSGLVATVVSLVTAYDVGFDPSVGLGVILLAVVATVIGGRGSFAGPVVAGMALGILRAAVTWTLSAQWQDAVTFVIFTTLLLLAPDGLITLIHPDRGAA